MLFTLYFHIRIYLSIYIYESIFITRYTESFITILYSISFLYVLLEFSDFK